MWGKVGKWILKVLGAAAAEKALDKIQEKKRG